MPESNIKFFLKQTGPSYLESEEEQITDAYVSGSYDMARKEYNPQKYYEETYGSQAPQRLKEANGKE